MSVIDKVCFTSSVSAVSFIIYTFIFKPISDTRNSIGNIRSVLATYYQVILTPESRTFDLSKEAHEKILAAGIELDKIVSNITLYDFLAKLFYGSIPRKSEVNDAIAWLRGLSTHVYETGDRAIDSIDVISKIIERIEKNLRLNK